MKKIVSLMMITLMAISFMPWSVFAEESVADASEPETVIAVTEEESTIIEENVDVMIEGEPGYADVAPENGGDAIDADESNNIENVSTSDSDNVYSGTCGDNLTWTLTTETESDMVLTITGSGPMMNYSYKTREHSPWYSYREKIVKAVLKEGVTRVGKSAFFDCANLTSITIPDSVTYIGRDAFNGCSGLGTINLPNNIEIIEVSAFAGCSSLETITLPESLNPSRESLIAGGLFEGCYNLKAVYNIPTNANNADFASYGSRAFKDCRSLTQLNISDGTTFLSQELFSGCINLKQVIIPASVNYIADNAFDGCPQLVLVVNKGSYAERFAKEKKLRYSYKPVNHNLILVAKAATCQESGVKKHFRCTDCGRCFKDAAGKKELSKKEIKKLTIKKKKHNFKEKSGEYLKSAATCTKPAYYYYTCKMCHQKGKKTYKVGKALGHDYVPGNIKKATGKKDGKIASKCSRCGKTNKGAKIPKASKIVVLNKKSIKYVGAGGEKDLIKVVVKKSKYPLNENEYEVSYSEPVYKGKKSKGTVTVKFKPECKYYSGTMTLTYKITKAPKK